MKWYKHYIDESLFGSLRHELTPPERSIWWDLLSMAGKSRRPGIVQANAGHPYDLNWLASFLVVTRAELQTTLQKCQEQGRLSIQPDGIYITNWRKYQGKYEVKAGKPKGD